MDNEYWPKVQILHPWPHASEVASYIPFSTLIVGWAIDPGGPCRVELRLGETVIASALADSDETHPSAIAIGGLHYRRACGFSFTLDRLVDADISEPAKFAVRAVAESGRWSECAVEYSIQQQVLYLDIRQHSLDWEQASLQKLLVHSFSRRVVSIYYVFTQEDVLLDRQARQQNVIMRARDISQFFPICDRQYYLLDEDLPADLGTIKRIRSLADLTVNPQDFVFIIDPSGGWSYDDEVRSICAIIVARFGSGTGNQETTRANIPICVCGDDYNAMAEKKYFDPNSRPHHCRSERQALIGEGNVFIHVNGPICDPHRIKTILVIKLDRIGDVISMIPALRELRGLFPNAEISAFVSAYTAAIIEALHVVDEIFVRGTEWSVPDKLWDLVVDLRIDADTRFVLQGARAHLKLSARLPEETFVGRPEHLTVTTQLPAPGAGGRLQTQHVTERLTCLIGGFGAHFRSFFQEAALLDKLGDLAPIGEKKAYIVVAPGPPGDVRSWPAQRLAQLVIRCAQSFDLVIRLVGTEIEAGECASVERFLIVGGVPCVNLCATLSSDELLWEIRRASFFVGADSGPKHIASLFGVPGICIHGGRHSPRVWGSTSPAVIDVYSPVICSPCMVNTVAECWNGLLCLRNISIDHAWNTARIAWAMSAWRTKYRPVRS